MGREAAAKWRSGRDEKEEHELWLAKVYSLAPALWGFADKPASEWEEQQCMEMKERTTGWQAEHAELNGNGWERYEIGLDQSEEFAEELNLCPICMNDRPNDMHIIACGEKSKGLHKACGVCLRKHWNWTLVNPMARGEVKRDANGAKWLHMRCPTCQMPATACWDKEGEVVNELMAIRM